MKRLEMQEVAEFSELVMKDNYLVTRLLVHMSLNSDSCQDCVESVMKFIVSINGEIQLIKTAIAEEVAISTKESIFRGESVASKVVTWYLFREGHHFLSKTVQPIISDISKLKESLEINPARVDASVDTEANMHMLLEFCSDLLEAIFKSIPKMPIVFRRIFAFAKVTVEAKFPNMKTTIVGVFLFLRFLVPALVSPFTYGLSSGPPPPHVRRSLLLVSKVLQNLANGTAFEKEEYMKPLNAFLANHQRTMDEFFEKVGSAVSITDMGDRKSKKLLGRNSSRRHRSSIGGGSPSRKRSTLTPKDLSDPEALLFWMQTFIEKIRDRLDELDKHELKKQFLEFVQPRTASEPQPSRNLNLGEVFTPEEKGARLVNLSRGGTTRMTRKKRSPVTALQFDGQTSMRTRLKRGGSIIGDLRERLAEGSDDAPSSESVPKKEEEVVLRHLRRHSTGQISLKDGEVKMLKAFASEEDILTYMPSYISNQERVHLKEVWAWIMSEKLRVGLLMYLRLLQISRNSRRLFVGIDLYEHGRDFELLMTAAVQLCDRLSECQPLMSKGYTAGQVQFWLASSASFKWALEQLLPANKDQSDSISVLCTLHENMYRVMMRQVNQMQLSGPMKASLKSSWAAVSKAPYAAGKLFVSKMLTGHPDILKIFGKDDMEQGVQLVMTTLDSFVRSVDRFDRSVVPKVEGIAEQLVIRGLRQEHIVAVKDAVLSTLDRLGDIDETARAAWEQFLDLIQRAAEQPIRERNRLLDRAEEFIREYYRVHRLGTEAAQNRIDAIRTEILETGTYRHTYEELAYGMMVTWRNSSSCSARSTGWKHVHVRDLRHVNSAKGIMEGVRRHMKYEEEDPDRVHISVFPPRTPGATTGVYFWNQEVISLAGWAAEGDGNRGKGDPANVALTSAISGIGWSEGDRGDASVLPLVVQIPGEEPYYETVDERAALVAFDVAPGCTVYLPRYNARSDYMTTIGGIHYAGLIVSQPALASELAQLAARRSDVMAGMARHMGIPLTRKELWRDRVLLELVIRVSKEFTDKGLTVLDPYEVSRAYDQFIRENRKIGVHTPPFLPSSLTYPCSVMALNQAPLLEPLAPHFVTNASIYLAGSSRESDFQMSSEQMLFARNMRRLSKILARNHIGVLYSREDGELYALRLSKRLAASYKLIVGPLEDASMELLSGLDLVIIVCNNPSGGVYRGRFYRRLSRLSDEEKLTRVNYIIVGIEPTLLAPRIEPFSCWLDKRLEALGAVRLMPTELLDSVVGVEPAFERWVRRTWILLLRYHTVASNLYIDDASETKRSTMNPRNLKVVLSKPSKKMVRESSSLIIASVVSKEVVAMESRKSSMRSMVVDDHPNTRLLISLNVDPIRNKIKAGDCLYITPHNNPVYVEHMKGLYQLDAGASVSVEPDQPGMPFFCPIEKPLTVGGIFARGIEMMLKPPLKSLLMLMHEKATEKGELKLLGRMLEDIAMKESAETEIIGHYVTLPNLLESFPSALPTFGELIGCVPVMSPRAYVVYQVNKEDKEISIAVSLLSFTRRLKDDTVICIGTASQYLNSIKVGEVIKMSVVRQPFHLPKDASIPLMLVGSGVAVSPFAGFMRERLALQEDGKVLGDCVVYCGCRSRQSFLFTQEWHQAVQGEALSRMEVIFSRDQKKAGSKYVQHVMWKNAAHILDRLVKEQGRIYIIGDLKMIYDVLRLFEKVLVERGGYPNTKAKEKVSELCQSQIVIQPWGLMLHYTDAMVTYRSYISNAARMWLRAVFKKKKASRKN